ncbi:MAG: tRNA (guanosine(46)-N7)-methyltransferase TrmB [Phycisphaerae bacterium]|nr:tRNA (guanosine(46)-N7)-methyltransferase TrmB [Phycisphaerae bacterium]
MVTTPRAWDSGDVLLDEKHIGEQFDPREMFDTPSQRPIEVEIGVGKGTFLLQRATQRREIDFLGVEYARAYAIYTTDRVRRAQLDNVKMLCADAKQLVESQLVDDSVWRVHVYFPDPWPKRRHNRRRLIQPLFVEHVRRVLQPGGQFLLVTDHREYFEQIIRVVADAPGFARIPFPQLLEDSDHVVGTNFEKKYVKQGRPIFKTALIKYI